MESVRYQVSPGSKSPTICVFVLVGGNISVLRNTPYFSTVMSDPTHRRSLLTRPLPTVTAVESQWFFVIFSYIQNPQGYRHSHRVDGFDYPSNAPESRQLNGTLSAHNFPPRSTLEHTFNVGPAPGWPEIKEPKPKYIRGASPLSSIKPHERRFKITNVHKLDFQHSRHFSKFIPFSF